MKTHKFLLGVLVLLGCASPTLKARLVNSEKRANEGEEALDAAEKAMAALEPGEAESQLARAKQSLSDSDVGYYPEREGLSKRLSKDEARLPDIRKQRIQRDLEIAVGERQKKIDDALYAFRGALEAIDHRDLPAQAVKDAKSKADAFKSELDDGKSLEPRDSRYAAYANQLRALLDKAAPKLELAQLRIAFIEGPGSNKQKAVALLKDARTEKDRKSRRHRLDEAREKFARCAEEGKSLIARQPALAVAPVLIGGAGTTPQAVERGCDKSAKNLEKQLKPSNPPRNRKAGSPHT